MTTTKWQNWARTASAKPQSVHSPTSTDEVAQLVQQAAEGGRTIRMIGSGHSFTSTAVANDMMLMPTALSERFEVHPDSTVTVGAGMDLTTLCHKLDGAGLALTNMGDVRVQTLAGATQTGTHGTGRLSGTFAEMIEELEIVVGDGSVRTVNAQSDPDLFNSARVGIGAFGIVTAIRIRVEPSFVLKAHEFPSSFEETCDKFDYWRQIHDHFEFYWMPHTDTCAVKHNDRVTGPPEPPSPMSEWWEESFLQNTVFGALCRFGRTAPGYVPLINKLTTKVATQRNYSNKSWLVFTSPRRVRFAEMEYALPIDSLVPALKSARELIEERGWRISFPVEVRSVPADTAWLSTATERDTGYLAFHAFDRMDRTWFTEIESLLIDHGGRPHWGKMHTRTAEWLALAYPQWAAVAAVRDRVDPQRVFANDYTRRVLGE